MESKKDSPTIDVAESGNTVKKASITDSEGDSILQNVDVSNSEDPNRMLTPDDIAALLAQVAQEPVAEVPEPIEPTVEAALEAPLEEMTAALAPDPNRMMTPEDIAALLAQVAPEPTADAPEPVEPAEEVLLEEVTAAPAPDPNRMMTPEDIAALLAQVAPEPTAEAPEPVEPAEEAPLEDVTAAPAPDPNRMLTPDDIAALLAQVAPEPATEAPETFESQEEVSDVTETVQEVSPVESIGSTANRFETETPPPPEAVEESPFGAPVISEDESPAQKVDSPDASSNSEHKKQAHFIQQFMLLFKKVFTKKIKPVPETQLTEAESPAPFATPPEASADAMASSASPNTDAMEPVDDTGTESASKEKKPSMLNRILAALKRPPKVKKAKKAKKAVAKESASPKTDPSVETQETKAAGIPQKKSSLKKSLGVLVVICLMSISFAGGFFSRDLLAHFKPDPAQLKAEAEAKVKKEQDEKRAQELAGINPKDYTSSMYLDSIILKGKAGKMTSIKLKKIDNVEKLTEFHNLKKIKLVDMAGDEDLSVIQQLKGIEEISIENSVLKKQFNHGEFSSVTYIEMYDSTVENPSAFANFKGLTELYVYASKFPSPSGNLELTSFLPAIESLTLSSCGDYGELVGINNLSKLKTLNLTSRTLVKGMTYVDNPQIETATVDISFAENLEQLQPLANFKSIKTLKLLAKEELFNTAQLRQVKNWIYSINPNVTIDISTY